MLNIPSLHKCWLSWLPNTLLLHTNINFSAFLNYNLPGARSFKDKKQKFKILESTTPDLKTQYSANIKIFILRFLKHKQNKKHSGTMWMGTDKIRGERGRYFFIWWGLGELTKEFTVFLNIISICFSLLHISARASNPNAFLKNVTFPDCPSFPKVVLPWPLLALVLSILINEYSLWFSVFIV